MPSVPLGLPKFRRICKKHTKGGKGGGGGGGGGDV